MDFTRKYRLSQWDKYRGFGLRLEKEHNLCSHKLGVGEEPVRESLKERFFVFVFKIGPYKSQADYQESEFGFRHIE